MPVRRGRGADPRHREPRAADDHQHHQRYPCAPEHSSERHPLPCPTPVALRYVCDRWDELSTRSPSGVRGFSHALSKNRGPPLSESLAAVMSQIPAKFCQIVLPGNQSSIVPNCQRGNAMTLASYLRFADALSGATATRVSPGLIGSRRYLRFPRTGPFSDASRVVRRPRPSVILPRWPPRTA